MARRIDRFNPNEFRQRLMFWSRVAVGADGECWPWLGARDNYGYGTPWFNGKVIKAHRLAWMLERGEIPESSETHGMCVLHRCDNPPCVNPSHLFLGTNHDNVLDRVAKGRSNSCRGEKHGRAKLTAADIVAIRQSESPSRALSRQFGVAKSVILDIKHRRIWKTVP